MKTVTTLVLALSCPTYSCYNSKRTHIFIFSTFLCLKQSTTVPNCYNLMLGSDCNLCKDLSKSREIIS